MKRTAKLLSLFLAICVLLTAAFASGEPSGSPSGEPSSGEPSGEAVLPGSYTDGTYTLIIGEDLTFSMDKTGQNMEGEDFILTVTGHVEPDGGFVIDGLFDGDINLVEVAAPEQVAGDLATVEAVYAAAKAASGEPGAVAAGTYTDGVNTLVIAEDGTFSMNKTGQNMEGEDFILTVTGHVEPDGGFVIDGLFDGDINLIEVATPEQVAGDLASVESAFRG